MKKIKDIKKQNQHTNIKSLVVNNVQEKNNPFFERKIRIERKAVIRNKVKEAVDSLLKEGKEGLHKKNKEGLRQPLNVVEKASEVMEVEGILSRKEVGISALGIDLEGMAAEREESIVINEEKCGFEMAGCSISFERELNMQTAQDLEQLELDLAGLFYTKARFYDVFASDFVDKQTVREKIKFFLVKTNYMRHAKDAAVMYFNKFKIASDYGIPKLIQEEYSKVVSERIFIEDHAMGYILP